MSVLIFPAGLQKAIKFKSFCDAVGLSYVEATSDRHLLSDSCLFLPYVTEQGFESRLVSIMHDFNVDRVYTSHAGVWTKLKELSEDPNFPISFKLCGDWPNSEDLRVFQEAILWAGSSARALAFEESLLPELSLVQYANLYRGFFNIPGESDGEKLWLLAQVFRHAKAGDVVEIGSAYGRSSYALAWLSDFYNTGSVISVDPWSFEASEDQGEQASLINKGAHDVNWEGVFRAFLISLAGFKSANYIRETSDRAIATYCDAAQRGWLASPEFGKTPLAGEISILHIDGNHKYEAVKADINKWRPYVMKGGWILLDDYLWAFGDGPKRAGDELLEDLNVYTSFVVGDTLCLRLN